MPPENSAYSIFPLSEPSKFIESDDGYGGHSGFHRVETDLICSGSDLI